MTREDCTPGGLGPDRAPLLRPSFTVGLDGSPEEAADAIRSRLSAMPQMEGRWLSKGKCAELYLPEPERRLWSPYVSIRLDEADEGCTLHGRFAPHPEVWTFFMFLYFLVVFLVLFGATLGYVQWASSEPAWGLWAVWIGFPVLALIHVASAVGARLGRDQMRRLKDEVDQALSGIADPGSGAG